MDQEQKEQKDNKCGHRGKVPVFGYILIVIGLIFLFEKVFNFSVFAKLPWDYIWPTLIILFGIHIVYKKSK